VNGSGAARARARVGHDPAWRRGRPLACARPAAAAQLHAAWRGEPMTGTRATGCPGPAVAGDGAASPLDTRPRRPDPAIPSPSPPILRPALDGPRSFVPAALRALHHDPVGGLLRACHQEGKADQQAPGRTATLVEGLDRPRSFRDDKQRNPSCRDRRRARGRPPRRSLHRHPPPRRPSLCRPAQLRLPAPTTSAPTTTVDPKVEVVARLREILRVRDRAFKERNPELLTTIYTSDCPCLEGDRNAINELLRENYLLIGGSTSIRPERLERVNDRLWLVDATFYSAAARIETESGKLIRKEPAGRDQAQFAMAKPARSAQWLLGRATSFRRS
jgi:hypothetical protein